MDNSLINFWVVALAMLPLAVNFQARLAYEPIKITLLAVLAVSGLVAILISYRKRWSVLMKPLSVIEKWWLVGVSASLIATIFSVDPERSFFGSPERRLCSLALLALTAVFFIFARVLDERARRLFFRASMVVVAIISVYALFQAAHFDHPKLVEAFVLEEHPEFHRAFSTLGHPNFLGAYLALVITFYWAGILSISNVKRRRGYFLLTGLAVTALVLTFSRAAYAALFSGFLTMFILLAPTFRAKCQRVAMSVLMIGGFIIILVAFKPWLLTSANPFLVRTAEALDWKHGSARVRIEEWRYGARLIARRPLFGYGAETYLSASRQRQKRLEEAGLAAVSPDPSVADRLHNLELDTLWSSGLFGLLALGGLYATAFWVVVRKRALESFEERIQKIALGAALVANFIALQFSFETGVTAMFSAVIFGCLSVSSNSLKTAMLAKQSRKR